MIKINLLLLIALTLIVFVGCKDLPKEDKMVLDDDENNYTEEELYRPNFHFTPHKNWMNDPNGMFYLEGKYHLFFQYYPNSTTWGPMHWGHAISTNLITWEEQQIALYPDQKGYIFSGSAVVDNNNTSGFKSDSKIPVVAMFTYHDPKLEKEGKINYQSQGIAFSLDEGLTWEKYEGNPVIKNPGIKDFRDPKMTWDAIHNQWILILASGNKAMFYKSTNLKDWDYLSEFGENIGAHGGIWECPDFFPMKIENSNETKWVLIQSLVAGGPNGGTATQYFIGDFDGKEFILDTSFKKQLAIEKAKWLDYGRDNYAGVTWSNIPKSDGRKLFIGWMSNWEYAEKVPTNKWRSSMTIPRELKLVKSDNRYTLLSQPVNEIKKFASKIIKKQFLKIEKEIVLATKLEFDFSSLDIELKLKITQENTVTFSFKNNKNESIKFGLNNKEKFFFFDRMKSGNLSFSNKFAPQQSIAPFKDVKENVNVRILLDKTSIEIFYNDGETIMTEIFFMQEPIDEFTVKSEKSNSEIETITIKQLKFE